MHPRSIALGRSRHYATIAISSSVCWLCILVIVLAVPGHAQAAPRLILPTPPGESWKVIQGYGCGTHNAWDYYSLDLASANGRTYGAPVRAAADGRVSSWTSGSGTLILEHGGGFFTMYTHMQSVVTTRQGQSIAQGQVIGTVGDRGSPGVPHLHFTAFTGQGRWGSGRSSVPVSFAEGYNLPDVGGCNQHFGKLMVAGVIPAPEVVFSSNVEPEHWYNTDQRIEFRVNGGGGGISQAWDSEPAADAPMFASVTDGYAQLSDKGDGMHTLFVRAWGQDGQQTLATFGPVGYDSTPPDLPALMTASAVSVTPQTQSAFRWAAATDEGSGVKGYRVYVGADREGTSEWFVEATEIPIEPLEPGTYVVRVQVLDNVDNMSDWRTVGEITVK